jgi:hypothetical protein
MLCSLLQFFDLTSLFFLFPPPAHFCFRNWKSSPLLLFLLFSWVLLLSYSHRRSIILTSIHNMKCILHHPQSTAYTYSICHIWLTRNQPISVLRHFYQSLTFDFPPFCFNYYPSALLTNNVHLFYPYLNVSH